MSLCVHGSVENFTGTTNIRLGCMCSVFNGYGQHVRVASPGDNNAEKTERNNTKLTFTVAENGLQEDCHRRYILNTEMNK